MILGRVLLTLACIPLVIPSQVCWCHEPTHSHTAPTGLEIVPQNPEPIPSHSCCSHKKKSRELGFTSHSENQYVTERDSSKNQCVTERDSSNPFPPIHEPYCPVVWEHNPVSIIYPAQKGLCGECASLLISVNLLENRSGPPPPYVNYVPTYFFQTSLFVALCRLNI